MDDPPLSPIPSGAGCEHWSNTKVRFSEGPCVWTQGIRGQTFEIPVAHGEGCPVFSKGFEPITAVTYGVDAPTKEYPASPNGSSIAGICSPNGRILGLFPHFERRISPSNGGDQGLALFRAGVSAAR